MSGTANRNAPYIAASQNNKYLTHNQGLDRLDAATSETLALSVASGNAAPTAEQYRAAMRIALSGATSSGRTLTLPIVKQPISVTLAAASTKTVSIVRGSSSFTLYPGVTADLYTDGTANGLLLLAEHGVYRPALWVRGAPSNGEIVHRWKAPHAFTLLPDLLGWVVEADIAADSTAVFEVRKNGTAVATLTWAAAGTTPTLATTGNAAQSFAAGDFFDIKGPASADATLGDISIVPALVRA